MSGTQIAIPEHLKKFLTNPAASSDSDAMAAASISIPRVSLRGRKFRLIEGGEEIRRPADELFVVILAVEPGAGLMSKTFYAKGYVSGDSAPPDCSSANGITPDTWISSPVNAKCNGCPKNVFGSATSRTGGKAKACKDSKRLWVVEPDKIDGTVYAMGVPVTSLKAMAEYGSLLKANGIPPSAVITKLTMKDTEYPELEFSFVGVLEEKACETSMLRHEQRNWNIGASGPLLDHEPARPMQAPGAEALAAALDQPAPAQVPLEAAGTAAPALSPDQALSNW